MRHDEVTGPNPRESMMTEPLAVDVRDAARLTSLSVPTIRAYIRRGKLRATHIGRRIVIPVEALRELIRGGATES